MRKTFTSGKFDIYVLIGKTYRANVWLVIITQQNLISNYNTKEIFAVDNSGTKVT